MRKATTTYLAAGGIVAALALASTGTASANPIQHWRGPDAVISPAGYYGRDYPYRHKHLYKRHSYGYGQARRHYRYEY